MGVRKLNPIPSTVPSTVQYLRIYRGPDSTQVEPRAQATDETSAPATPPTTGTTNGKPPKIPPAQPPTRDKKVKPAPSTPKSNTLFGLGLGTAGLIITSILNHTTEVLGNLKNSLGTIIDILALLLATIFTAGALTQPSDSYKEGVSSSPRGFEFGK